MTWEHVSIVNSASVRSARPIRQTGNPLPAHSLPFAIIIVEIGQLKLSCAPPSSSRRVGQIFSKHTKDNSRVPHSFSIEPHFFESLESPSRENLRRRKIKFTLDSQTSEWCSRGGACLARCFLQAILAPCTSSVSNRRKIKPCCRPVRPRQEKAKIPVSSPFLATSRIVLPTRTVLKEERHFWWQFVRNLHISGYGLRPFFFVSFPSHARELRRGHGRSLPRASRIRVSLVGPLSKFLGLER